MKNKNNFEKVNIESDKDFFDINMKLVNSIKPKKDLLTKTLSQINLETVTNTDPVRNISVRTGSVGRDSMVSSFIKIINNMNNYIKILSGGAIVSALIIAMVLINKTDNKISPLVINKPIENNVANTDKTKIEVGGEVLNVDSLLADLNNIDSTYSEPIFEDSDLTASLINTNDYEIQ